MAKSTSILHSFLYLYLFRVSSPFLLSRSGVCFLAPLIWAALVICFDWERGGGVSDSSEPSSLESFHSQNPAPRRRTHLAYLAGEWENTFRRTLYFFPFFKFKVVLDKPKVSQPQNLESAQPRLAELPTQPTSWLHAHPCRSSLETRRTIRITWVLWTIEDAVVLSHWGLELFVTQQWLIHMSHFVFSIPCS